MPIVPLAMLVGGMSIAPDKTLDAAGLKTNSMGEGDIVKLVSNCKCAMPAFGGRRSDEICRKVRRAGGFGRQCREPFDKSGKP